MAGTGPIELAIVVLCVASAFFSSSEAAFLSVISDPRQRDSLT